LTLLFAILATVLSLLPAGTAHAETSEGSNPNQYECKGHLGAGQPEPGAEGTQVLYVFYCDGPISGYQVQSQVALDGFEASPLVSDLTGKALTDTFSCGGEVPGYAVNCVGATKLGGEVIAGQFSIGSRLCAPPLVDPLLTVTYAYIEKGAIVQAISGPYDLGRPYGCGRSAYSLGTRLDPQAPPLPGKHSKRKRRPHGKRTHKRA
jgi:hypothetical protein